MAHGVEDPVDGESEFPFGADARAFESCEDGLEARWVVIAPHVDDADGDEDFSVDDALLGEMLHHAPRCEFVVFSVHELAGDGFERFDEAGEIGEPIEGFGLGMRDGRGVVTLAEFGERGGRDGAFEVKVKLGLGEAVDEGLDIVHL